MADPGVPVTKRVDLMIPMRTVLLVAAAIAVFAAFVAIGSTFLLVFLGIFLALVFENPVRLVMAKTGLSRGLAATVTVLAAASRQAHICGPVPSSTAFSRETT